MIVSAMVEGRDRAVRHPWCAQRSRWASVKRRPVGLHPAPECPETRRPAAPDRPSGFRCQCGNQALKRATYRAWRLDPIARPPQWVNDPNDAFGKPALSQTACRRACGPLSRDPFRARCPAHGDVKIHRSGQTLPSSVCSARVATLACGNRLWPGIVVKALACLPAEPRSLSNRQQARKNYNHHQRPTRCRHDRAHHRRWCGSPPQRMWSAPPPSYGEFDRHHEAIQSCDPTEDLPLRRLYYSRSGRAPC